MSSNSVTGRGRLPLLVAAAIALVLVPADPAGAHALVEKTSPTIDEVVERSPGRVVIDFSEPVEVAFGAIRVYDTNGNRVDDGEADHVTGNPDRVAVDLEPDLPHGTYTVTWQVVSADSHPISEAFVFHVGAPGNRPEGIASEVLGGESGSGGAAGALFGATRAIMFGALLVLVGALVFTALVWLRAAHVGRPEEVERDFARRLRFMLVWSWSVLLVTTIASLVLQAASAGGSSLTDAATPSAVAEVLQTRYGRVALLRLALLGGGAVLYAIGRRIESVPVLSHPRFAGGGSVGAAAAARPLQGWMIALGGLWALALAATPGLQGHAGTTSPVPVNLIADVLHVGAAGAWIGGLVALLCAAWPAARQAEGERAVMLAPVVARLSEVALVAVALIVVTGTYRSFVEVGAWRGLTGTAYGLTLLAKLAVFAPLLVLGAVNNRLLKPRIGDAARGRASLATLRRVVTVEVALGVVVLAITSLLVNLAPARVEAGIEGPFTAHVRLGEANLDVLVDPNKVGSNEVHLTATQPSGGPLRVRGMRVLFRMPEEDIGPIVGRGHRLAPGHYVVHGNQLSVPGEWRLEIVARIDKFTDERATVDVTVNE